MLHFNNMKATELGSVLREKTETFLSWRKMRILEKKEKSRQKNPLIDWIEAFLWAAMIVLLINQYFFQAYRIPTGSMIPSLKIGDNLFVNKNIYGPELLPGLGKLRGFKEPERNEIIIFENPDYQSKGPMYTVVKRLIYMLTLSLVDIERMQSGAEVQDLLIKRAIGFPGDRIRYFYGETHILPAGTATWLNMDHYKAQFDIDFPIQRLAVDEGYKILPKFLRFNSWTNAGLLNDTDEELRELSDMLNSSVVRNERELKSSYDRLQSKIQESAAYLALFPENANIQRQFFRETNGWYVPKDRVLPMGDNRDDSRDGRYFGTVSQKDVLGKAAFRYWPLARMGFTR